MDAVRVNIRIWGGWGFGGKESAVRTALVRSGLPLSPAQVSIERGDRQQLKVDIVRGGKATTLISRQGAGYYEANTPAEIADAIRAAL